MELIPEKLLTEAIVKLAERPFSETIFSFLEKVRKAELAAKQYAAREFNHDVDDDDECNERVEVGEAVAGAFSALKDVQRVAERWGFPITTRLQGGEDLHEDNVHVRGELIEHFENELMIEKRVKAAMESLAKQRTT